MLFLVLKPRLEYRVAVRACGPYFLRFARCGACRHVLPKQPAPDGLHVCQSCNAAWHPDRFISRSDSLTTLEIIGRLAAAPAHPTFGLGLDDRGCPLPAPSSPSRNAFPRDEERCVMGGARQARHARLREVDRSTWMIQFFCLGALAAAVALTSVGRGSPPWFAGVVWIGLMLAAAASSYFWLFTSREARRRMLAKGTCAGCGSDLTHYRPTFDSCVMCPTCGRAWKAERIEVPLLADYEYPWRLADPDSRAALELPLPDSRTLPPRQVLCRRCGYDMSGLEKCPECAYPDEPPRPWPPRGSVPACARCGTILPGEHRMCPKCGIMAGVEWVS